MIYHHDDNHVAPTKGASDLDAAKGIALAVAIGFGIALVLINGLAPCDGVLVCALAGVPLEQKRRLPLPGWAAIIWPEQEPHAEHNRQAWVRAVSLLRRSSGGWVLDHKPQERKQ